jgi:minor histocompatibility antigen H13
VLCFAVVLPLAVLYFKTKYWMLNNLIGIAIAMQGIEMVSLGSFKVGAILLCGLFFYDIFWVFGTDKLMTGESVMVVVAKGLDAPIKLLFPRVSMNSAVQVANEMVKEVVTTVSSSTQKPPVFNFAGDKLDFSMLGLGDIVIPGFLIALLLRFDAQNAQATPEHGAHGHFSKPYFHSNLVAYTLGLSLTITMMTYFEAAQPALLYLVPACLGAALLMASFRGELSLLFEYDENRKEEEEVEVNDASPTNNSNKISETETSKNK